MKKKRELKTETLQKKTYKRFPDAKAVTDEYGLWYIMDQDGEDTFEEFFIPHCSTEREAWEQGHVTARTIQNFNRSHPLKSLDGGFSKMEDSDKEAKASRINKRKRNSKKL